MWPLDISMVVGLMFEQSEKSEHASYNFHLNLHNCAYRACAALVAVLVKIGSALIILPLHRYVIIQI